MEQELAAIELLKLKQKREIEQIVSYELKMNQIKKRNEDKAV